MFTNYRIKFHMKSVDTKRKVFMESDLVRVMHHGHDEEEMRVRAVNTMAARCADKHAPRFRPQLFCCYVSNNQGEV